MSFVGFPVHYLLRIASKHTVAGLLVALGVCVGLTSVVAFDCLFCFLLFGLTVQIPAWKSGWGIESACNKSSEDAYLTYQFT